MFSSFIIVLREVIEAGLIVGIVLAATRGIAHRGAWVALGVAGGIAGAVVVAFFAGTISEFFNGYGQELFNASILLLAVVMLAWHHAWMASHGRELAAEVQKVGNAVAQGERPLTALAVVCGVAVLREGAEVVLFLYGFAAGGTTGSEMLTGGLLGVAGGVGVTLASYLGLMVIPQRYIFTVTGWLITLLAAGLAAQAVTFLNSANVLTAFGEQLWDTSGMLPQGSIPGVVLRTLVGYSDHPTQMQLIAWVATIVIMVGLARMAGGPSRDVHATA